MFSTRHPFFRGFRFAALAWALIIGFAAQSHFTKQHETRHGIERLVASGSSGVLKDGAACSVCDAIHIAHETPQASAGLGFTLHVTRAEPVRPVLFSDKAILFPLGARAPPAVRSS